MSRAREAVWRRFRRFCRLGSFPLSTPILRIGRKGDDFFKEVEFICSKFGLDPADPDDRSLCFGLLASIFFPYPKLRRKKWDAGRVEQLRQDAGRIIAVYRRHGDRIKSLRHLAADLKSRFPDRYGDDHELPALDTLEKRLSLIGISEILRAPHKFRNKSRK